MAGSIPCRADIRAPISLPGPRRFGARADIPRTPIWLRGPGRYTRGRQISMCVRADMRARSCSTTSTLNKEAQLGVCVALCLAGSRRGLSCWHANLQTLWRLQLRQLLVCRWKGGVVRVIHGSRTRDRARRLGSRRCARTPGTNEQAGTFVRWGSRHFAWPASLGCWDVEVARPCRFA